jgi:uncharacterized protein YuzE
MDILIQRDLENDACYLAFGVSALDKGAVRRSKAVSDDITLDFDAQGRLLGIDILNASSVLPERLEANNLDALVGVKEAASIAGVQRSNFVRDMASREDFPAPVCELSTGRVWLRSQVEAYLATHRSRSRRAS